MKKLLIALFILFIAEHSFAQSEIAFASYKVSPFIPQLRFSQTVEDSSATGKTAEIQNASTTISAFYAKRNKKNVELTWQPPSDESKSVFLVQRKSGEEWETIAYIPCSSTSTDNLPSVYTYTDVNISKAETEYQVKEVVDHGNIRSSKVAEVMPEHTNSFTASAGYGKVRLTFKTDDVRDIKIFNSQGKLVKEANQVADKSFQLAVPASGELHLLVREQSTGAVSSAEVYTR